MAYLLSIGLVLALIAVYGFYISAWSRIIRGQSALFVRTMWANGALAAMPILAISLGFQFTEGRAEQFLGVVLLAALVALVRAVLQGNRRYRERTYQEIDRAA